MTGCGAGDLPEVKEAFEDGAEDGDLSKDGTSDLEVDGVLGVRC